MLIQDKNGGLNLNIYQLQYAIAIAEYGSISKAAQKLFVSQPHLSKSIQIIEGEMGYPIFTRTSKGVTITEKGSHFLRYARTIVQEHKKMQLLSNYNSTTSFKLAAGSFYLFIQSFVETCTEYQNGETIDFIIHHSGVDTIVNEIQQGISDLGVLLIPATSVESFKQSMKNKNITAHIAGFSDVNINLRKEHPLLENGTLTDFTKLKNYPFVDYFKKDIYNNLDQTYSELVNPEKLILIEEREIRHLIVANTNAFSIGCTLSKEIYDRYNIHPFLLAKSQFAIFYIYRSENPLTEESKSFIKHLYRLMEGFMLKCGEV